MKEHVVKILIADYTGHDGMTEKLLAVRTGDEFILGEGEHQRAIKSRRYSYSKH
jgi:hypothetical protein